MCKVLSSLLLSILALALTPGCSRQPTPHVGEWDGKMKVIAKDPEGFQKEIVLASIFYFSKDGKVKITGTDFHGKKTVEEGEYTIDYSKEPARMEIHWQGDRKNQKKSCNILFIGEHRDQMHLCNCNYPEPVTPRLNSDNQMCWYLTKKVK